MNIQRYFSHILSPLVHCIWEQKSLGPMAWQILPSGCLELIFRLGPQLEQVDSLQLQQNPTRDFCFLSGLHTQTLKMRFVTFHNLGIQLSPLAAQAFFRIPCAELQDWALPGEELFKDLAQLEEHLQQAPDFQTRCRHLESFLLARIQESPELWQALRLKRRLEQGLRQGRVLEPENLMGYSRTQTYRLFKTWFGLAPSQYMRLEQFTQSIAQIHRRSDSLTQIAQASGYFDQAHFVRSFRHFAGITPGYYKKHRSELPGQLNWQT